MQRTRYAKPKLKVLVVVSEVVLLHLAHVLRKPGVVKAIEGGLVSKQRPENRRIMKVNVRIVHAVIQHVCGE